MQTTSIMTEECIDFIYSCIMFPNLSQVRQPPGRALGGAVPCQATNSGQADPPARITIPCSLKVSSPPVRPQHGHLTQNL